MTLDEFKRELTKKPKCRNVTVTVGDLLDFVAVAMAAQALEKIMAESGGYTVDAYHALRRDEGLAPDEPAGDPWDQLANLRAALAELKDHEG